MLRVIKGHGSEGRTKCRTVDESSKMAARSKARKELGSAENTSFFISSYSETMINLLPGYD
jgi:hypothetical protein